MAADYNKPISTDNYLEILTQLRDNIAAAQNMLDDLTGVTNIPIGALRYDQTAKKFQVYDGTTFVDTVLSAAGGGTGAVTPLGNAAYTGNSETDFSGFTLSADLYGASSYGSKTYVTHLYAITVLYNSRLVHAVGEFDVTGYTGTGQLRLTTSISLEWEGIFDATYDSGSGPVRCFGMIYPGLNYMAFFNNDGTELNAAAAFTLKLNGTIRRTSFA